ncbi:Transcription factor Spt20 [Phaffia rhodozyma]|uniref:Transcription factor Spt20 n=1 Tax=Phaffia rhodozyma TaxID=264483 RepID=A0A0F7SXZ7_PHARH|nr:Transcription factor Spt20 [Phaffia rhodozyma]
MSTASVYNLARESRSILKRFRKASPSLSIELYPKHFRFKGQTGIFLYDSPMKTFLESIRAQQIPHDLLPYLPSPQIPYYDGCLIVELIDHRPTANVHPSVAAASSDATGSAKPPSDSSLKPEGQPATNVPPVPPPAPPLAYHGPGGKGPPPIRVVLHPTPASLWSDVCAMSEDVGQGSWDDWDVLQLEARIVAATAPPLYLGTSFYGTRVANASIAQTSPLAPPEAQQPYHAESSTSSGLLARKRARAHGSGVQRRDEMESQKSLYQVGEIRKQVGFQPNFSRLTQIEAFRSNPASNRPRSLASDISSTHPGLPPPSGTYPNYNPRPSGSGSAVNMVPNADASSSVDNPAGSIVPAGAEEGAKAARRTSVASSIGGDVGQDEQLASEPAVSEKKKTKKKKKKAQAEEQTKDADMDEPSTPAVASAPTPVDTPAAITTTKSKKGKSKKTVKPSEEAVPQTPASDSAPTPSSSTTVSTTAKKGKNKKAAPGVGMSPESHPPKKKQKTSTTASAASSAPTPGGTALPLGPPPVPSQAGHSTYAQKQPPPSSSPYVSSKTLPPTYPTGRPLTGGPNGVGGVRTAHGQGTGVKTLPGVPGLQSSQQLQMLQQNFQTQQGYPMQGMGMPLQRDAGQSGNGYMGGGVGSYPQQGQGW